MKLSAFPAFLTEKRTLPPRKSLKVVKKPKKKAIESSDEEGKDVGSLLGTHTIKRWKKMPEGPERDLARKCELDARRYAIIEARSYNSTGQATTIGARVESQMPHDRYRIRNQLDPADIHKNDMMWNAAERMREDFSKSNLQAKLGSSFQPRISGGHEQWSQEHQAGARERYRKAMNGISQPLRPVVFFVCIEGWAASDWAIKNGKTATDGIAILRLGLEELAHYYGYIKIKLDTSKSYMQ